MGGYPKTQRVVAGVLKDAIAEAGETPTSVGRKLRGPDNAVRRVVNLQRDVRLPELFAIAQELGVRPSTLVARMERRLKV